VILISATALVFAQASWGQSMNDYLACLQQGMPEQMSGMDRAARARIYRAATARCQTERERAIAAAVRNREPDQTAEEARRLAIDIIDTLDPNSK
jgi:hypothetical protein